MIDLVNHRMINGRKKRKEKSFGMNIFLNLFGYNFWLEITDDLTSLGNKQLFK